MCGIAGVHIKPEYKGKIPAGRLLDWLLIGILPRGDHATGFLSVGFDNQVQMDKAPVDAKAFVKKRKSIKAEPQTVLAHTRYATQGDPKDNRNNHPVNYGTTFLVHNGWITNDDEIYKKYDMERHAEVDTEAIAASLWNACPADTWGSADKALSELEGAIAISAIDIRRPGEVLLARGFHSPLIYIEAKQFYMWASTLSALKLAWGKVFGTPPSDDKFSSLDEGDIMVIRNGVAEIGAFSPSYGTRYTSNDYAWAYEGYYGNKDYDDSPNSDGYWIYNSDGTREFKRYTKRLTAGRRMDIKEKLAFSTPYSRGVAMTDYQPFSPISSEMKQIETFEGWAQLDLDIHKLCVEYLADLVNLEESMIQWLLFHVEPDTLETHKGLQAVRDYLDSKYSQFYDEVMEDHLAEEETATAAVRDSETEKTMSEILDRALGRGDETKPYPSFNPLYACIECGQYEMEDSGYCMECEVKQEVRAKVG